MTIHTWHWLIVCVAVGIIVSVVALWADDRPSGGWGDPGPVVGCMISVVSMFVSIIVGLILWLAGATLYIGVTP